MDSVTVDGAAGDGLAGRRAESVSALAAGITHDLTNTFASVNMALDLLGASTRESDRWIVSSLDASVRRGMEAVRQMLWLASAREKEPLVYQAVHLLRDVQKLLRDALPPSIALSSEQSEEVCLVEGEPLVLYQLLIALCRQAAAELALGGSLVLRARNVVLDETYAAQSPLARPGLHLQVEVESREVPSLAAGFSPPRGPGEPPQALLDALAKEGGLFTLRRLDAQTTAASVFLPAVPGTPVAVPPAAGARGSGEMVLVIEPHAALRGVLAAVLERHGYRAIAAQEAAEGVARLAAGAAPAAMVLFAARCVLGEGTGVLHAIRRLCPAAPILVTGERSAFAAVPHPGEPVATLESPFTAGELLRALEDGLARVPGASA